MAFEITRLDGRSNQQVLIDAAHDKEPDTILSYEELGKVLGFMDRARIQQVVGNAQRRMLVEHSRTLRNVRGVGYKLAHASEHVELSCGHRRKAKVQMKKGLTILHNVRWEEMDENQRNAHKGHMLVTQAVCNAVDGLERRLKRVEDAIFGAGEGKEGSE